MAKPKRSRTKLLRALKEKLAAKRFGDPSQWMRVRVDDPVTDYFPAGGPAVVAFANEMNNSPPMLGDGVRIEPGEIRDVTTVGGIFDVEKQKYREKYTLEP